MTPPRRRIRDWLPAGVGLLITAGMFVSVWVARARGWLQYPELKAYDAFVRARPADRSMADRVVLVVMTDTDITSGTINYPITDGQLATLLDTLLKLGPRVVGVDYIRDIPVVTLDEARQEADAARKAPATAPGLATAQAPTTQPDVLSRPVEDFPGPRRLYAIRTGDPRLVVGVKSGAGTLIGRPKDIPDERIALADWPIDADGVVRRGYLFAGDPAVGTYPTIASLLAQVYLAQETPPVLAEPVPPDDPATRDLKLGKAVFRHLQPNDGAYVGATTDGAQFLLDYRAPLPEDPLAPGGGGFKVFTVADVIGPRATVRPQDVAGKVVLIGVVNPVLKDFFGTPLVGSNRWGVAVHAEATDQLLRAALHGDQPTRFWPDWGETLWIALWAAAGGGVGLLVRRFARFSAVLALVLAGGAAALGLVCWLAFRGGLWLPVVPPMMTWFGAAVATTLWTMYLERADRQVVMHLLATHVSDDVAQALWDDREQFLDGGRIAAQPLTATVLFTDIKGFSLVSEKLPPAQLMAWLNELMEALSEAVYRNGGMVNKYIGDAVMAVFGVPIPRTTDAERRRDACNAVRCAVDMRATLDRLNQDWDARGLPRIGMRIGVYTGELVAGSLGSTRRLEYTVIGDTVNTAARLESFDKHLMDDDISARGCRILVGQSTAELLDECFVTRCLGERSLPGMEETVVIHGVIGLDPAGRNDSAGGAGGGPAAGDRTADSPVQGTEVGKRLQV